jgi:2-dehydro-3-deoxygluconokinase
VSVSESLWEKLRHYRLTALLAPQSPEACVAAYELFEPLGVVLEIALRTSAALDGIAAVRRRHPNALLLAGTVLTASQAEQAIAAGAAGIVSPDYLPPVVQVCVARDVMCVPGGLGDVGKQLAQKAEGYGCTLAELRKHHPYQWVHKLFPVTAGGALLVDVAAAWQAVYPELTVMYTGGVTFERLAEIVRRDPRAIICGSALTRRIEDAQATAAEAQRWLDVIHGRASGTPQHAPRTTAAQPTPAAGAVVTLGEIMLRLTPPPGRRFSQAGSLDASFGGAEANVAVALAQWGVPSRFVTAVPDQALGHAAIEALRAHGVDTNHVLRHGTRLGLYYLEQGAAQRPARVIYDRMNSAIAELPPGKVDWNPVFDGADWLHCTGITPALSPSTAELTRQALKSAKRAGLTVSFDLNYRAKLWPPQRAREILTPLMQHVDVLICNEEDAAQVFGIHAGNSDVAAGKLDAEAYRNVAEQLLSRFGFKAVAITLRENLSASDNRWSACLHDSKEFYISRCYPIHVVDRVGAGDAFAAGLIYAWRAGREPRQALEFAVAASCLKHTIAGDFNLVSVAEVEALAAGAAAGRIQR